MEIERLTKLLNTLHDGADAFADARKRTDRNLKKLSPVGRKLAQAARLERGGGGGAGGQQQGGAGLSAARSPPPPRRSPKGVAAGSPQWLPPMEMSPGGATGLSPKARRGGPGTHGEYKRQR